LPIIRTAALVSGTLDHPHVSQGNFGVQGELFLGQPALFVQASHVARNDPVPIGHDLTGQPGHGTV
jgi:hypothetical protein